MYPIIVKSIIEAGWVEVCIVVRVDGRGTNWLFLPSNSKAASSIWDYITQDKLNCLSILNIKKKHSKEVILDLLKLVI